MGLKIRVDENHSIDTQLKLVRELLENGGTVEIPCSKEEPLIWFKPEELMPEVQENEVLYDEKAGCKWYLVREKEESYFFKSCKLDICARIMYDAYEGPDYPCWYSFTQDRVKDEDVIAWAEISNPAGLEDYKGWNYGK